MDHRFIRWYWPYCFSSRNSSSATKNHIVGSSDGLCILSLLHAAYQFNQPLHRCLLPRYRRMKNSIGSSDSVFSFLLILACGIFSSLGPKSVYKDMLNNMVSLIGHVVMNYQNQTRTNGIWGHVRYNDTMGGPWSRIHPVQLKINYGRVIWMWIAKNFEESV
jgi:hypothetical protein